MSYEGYEQHICANGHRFDEPCLFDSDVTPVDETNCDGHGYIPPEQFQKLIVKEAVVERCNLGHNHEAEFRLPQEGELVRYYRTDKGDWAPIMRHQDHCKFWRTYKCYCTPVPETAASYSTNKY